MQGYSFLKKKMHGLLFFSEAEHQKLCEICQFTSYLLPLIYRMVGYFKVLYHFEI